MKVLDKKYKGTIWSNGKFPKEIVFDNLKEEDIPFIERIGMGFLIKEKKAPIVFDEKKFKKSYTKNKK